MNCIDCNYSTKNKQNFERHLKTKKHDKNANKSNLQKLYLCKYCQKDFKQKSNLQQHLEKKNSCKPVKIPHKTTQIPQNTTQKHTKSHKNMNVIIVKKYFHVLIV